jgi:hypothetical protein
MEPLKSMIGNGAKHEIVGPVKLAKFDTAVFCNFAKFEKLWLCQIDKVRICGIFRDTERCLTRIKSNEVWRVACCCEHLLIAKAPLISVENDFLATNSPVRHLQHPNPKAARPQGGRILWIFRDKERCSSRIKSNEVWRIAFCCEHLLVAKAPLISVENDFLATNSPLDTCSTPT